MTTNKNKEIVAMNNSNNEIGVYKGVKYLVGKWNGQDADFYLSTKTQKTAMSLRGIARMLDCDPKTVQNAGVKLNIVKEAELLTGQGIQGVNFITEDDIIVLLKSIRDSKRIKKETRDNADRIYDTFAQAGFRLMVMLEVAPEQVASEAIDRVTDDQKLGVLSERIEGKLVRNQFTQELKSRGVKGIGYAINTNAVYEALFDAPASELKKQLQVENPRDGMSGIQLAATKFAEYAAIERMKKTNATGNTATAKETTQAAKKVRAVLDDCLG